jgi:hypothetical protein
MTTSERSDPVGDNYYRPLRRADKASDILFYLAAVLSFAVVIIDEDAFPNVWIWANIAFVIFVFAFFSIGMICRLYLTPRAEDARRRDLFTNSFSINLTHEVSTGYYNNEETNPFRRMALSVMESSFFTKKIAKEMLFSNRIIAVGYLVGWLVYVLTRDNDLGLVAAGAQALFSEIIISKWFRLEWLRIRSEAVYELLKKLLMNSASFNNENTRAQVVEAVSLYETGKANAGIVLSDGIFQRRNPELSAEWDKILATLPSSKSR